MRKTLSLILALTMIVSLFAGLTVTASADYSGTGTFTKATGTLESGYYVFTYATATTMYPMSNSTASTNWIKPGTDFEITENVEDPDPSIVWYYDASTGTVNSAGDPTLFVSWPTTGNSAMPTTTATPLTITDTGDGVYNITVTATPERMLRYNTQSAGWRFYNNTTGKADFIILKLSDGGETPAHEHDWSGWTPNENGTHSRTCQAADCPIGTQTENCSFEDSVATEPSCVDEGELLHTCTVCGYMYSEAIPATGEHTDEDGDGFCDVCGQEMPAAETKYWVLIGGVDSISEAVGTGPIAITATLGDGSVFALSNTKGTSVAPTAVPCTAEDNYLTPEDVSDSDISWTIVAEDDGYTIYNAADPSTWLYSTSTNNGVRVGTNTGKTWVIDDASGYLKHVATGRYLGVYSGQDWRAYTNTTGNTAGQTFQFWKQVDEAPSHEHDWSGWTPNENGTHSRTCQAADCPIGTQTEACSFEDRVTAEPSCVDEGELLHTCTVCGYMYGEAIPATGQHADEDGDGFCDVCGQEMPEVVAYTLGTELHEGDRVVIFSPYASLALSTTASGRSLKGVAASISGEKLTVMSDDEETAVMTVEYDDATNFRLKLDNGEYLTSPATGDGLSFAAEASDYTLWNLSLANENGKTVFITNANAKYNGNYQRLEYYGAFTAYGYRTAAPYQFQLYILANPDAHVHDWDEGTVTAEPSCTAKGVRIFACSGCDETYTEEIPMVPHADQDEDGSCDSCGGTIYHEAEGLNDGDRLILVTGAFGKALTGTASGNYMASADVNAQGGVTVPVGDDNVWTVKTAEGGFYLVNSEGQYLCENSSNKLALGDENSVNILWTEVVPGEGFSVDGAFLRNAGTQRFVEFSPSYNNYQTYSDPTADYETWYAFSFYTLPAEPLPEASFTLSPTEINLEGFDENGDLLLPFTAETLVLGTFVNILGQTEVATDLEVKFYAGTLSKGDDSIAFQIYQGDLGEHWGNGDDYGIGFSEQSREGSILFYIDPVVLESAAAGTYTGTMRYTSDWINNHAAVSLDGPGPSGEIALTLVVPEKETIADGYYLLIAHGDDDWVIGSVDPANKFEPNGNAQDEWLLSTTLAVEDQIKVVRVENNAITGWWPNGEHTQYHVDQAHSGNVTIYFKTGYVDAWREFGGYFYIGSLLKPDTFADVYGCSLSLNGNIGLNFYLILSEQLLADDDACVTLGDKQIKFSEAATRVVGEDTLYQFSVSLHAKQMNDVVTLQVFDGQGNPVALYRHSNDEDLTETGYSYSVQNYIQKARETSTDEKLIALVNAMDDYGILAQLHFGYHTEGLPEVQGDLDSVTAESIAAFEKKVTPGTATGISFAGGTLVLDSATAIRLYFSLDEGQIGDYTFKLGSRKVTPKETEDGWMVEIPNIAAKDLDKTYTVKVTSSAGTVLTVKYSALSYAYSVLGGGSKAETLIDLVKGIVLYNRAANAYFG